VTWSGGAWAGEPDAGVDCPAGLVCYTVAEDRATTQMVADYRARAAKAETPCPECKPLVEGEPWWRWAILIGGVFGIGMASGVLVAR